MNDATDGIGLSPAAEEFATAVKKSMTFFIILGIGLMLAGVGSMAYPVYGGLALTAVIGASLIVSGVLTVGVAFAAAMPGGFFGLILHGLVKLAGGVLIFFYPLEGLAALTVVVGVLLFVVGGFRIFMAMKLKGLPGIGSMLFNGILSILLAVLIFAGFPESSEVVLGIFVGVDLFMAGVSMTFLSNGVRSTMKAAGA